MKNDFDNAQAFQEGWALFDDGELQRLDELEIFDSDQEALQYVCDKASAGSDYHTEALRLIRPAFIINPCYAGICFGGHDPSPDNPERWNMTREETH